MDEARYRYWETVFKAATMLSLLAGGVWTIWQHFEARKSEAATREQQARATKLEAQKVFLAKRHELYFDAVNAAATIARTKSDAERRDATDKFWKLYWGPMALVEDAKVEAAMVAFGRCVNGCEEGRERLSLDLAHACRDSIATSWDVDLATGAVKDAKP